MSISSFFSQDLKQYDFLCLINNTIKIESQHPHPIIFCFTPERIKKGHNWNCNKCLYRYCSQFPSFFCTFCDYDLCQNCIGKYKINQVEINKKTSEVETNQNNQFEWQNIYPEHKHFLTLVLKRNKNFSWKCNKCLKIYKNDESLFYCSLCDFNICKDCINKDNKKNILEYDIENPFNIQ